MKVIHIAENTDGYEIVTLLANRISRKNSMSLIEVDGVINMTGGFILHDTPEIREILDAIPNDKQYRFVMSFKVEPWVRSYADEPYGDLPAMDIFKG